MSNPEIINNTPDIKNNIAIAGNLTANKKINPAVISRHPAKIIIFFDISNLPSNIASYNKTGFIITFQRLIFHIFLLPKYYKASVKLISLCENDILNNIPQLNNIVFYIKPLRILFNLVIITLISH